ncbi:DNA gyrase subunit A [Candidatus Uhrbacteria bacterium CG10_big_fil_rev_8_21_14_0_10_48_11]|uniref:DNA gyrase subunit A n=1 Tax=Candidatus Uhrbacteria bacterium CG10_big_fil_rev_8_21_14_0_10_48_11 TaxID=1975037 RepID=A0A2M8LER0_9BACT|nr:MAG: DNA gyrase subunit A [Candidatus Uhrbacteria bacterium CG10_big_fil_rev_8_21_14_0_10_48_11]
MKDKDKKKESDITIIKNVGQIAPRGLVAEMEESYLDYAMSVIVSRALPDVRDGLKPVQRRILYAMVQTGLRANGKTRKSATVVGEVMGKYHPHGDSAIYDAMVRLAQPFSMRDPLIIGQGNFGSMDGDSAAAMRYTEAKLSLIAEELLADIDKNTVEFVPNYDGSHQEPLVLPGKMPNLLVNGTAGIAVGMATSIPPHNLGEVADAAVHLIDNAEATVEDLMQFVPGPDYPTGGTIYDIKAIREAYGTGRGSIVTRAKAEIEEEKSGAFRIVVTEIPYQVNKATLVERIATLVQDKKIEGIRDLRDESDKAGVRVVIELKKDSYPKKVLNQLYKHTELQQTFHLNMLALVDGVQPRVLNLKTVLEEYIKHRETVVKRRAEFELERARAKAHILEGLKIAEDNIDAVIKLIKKSADKDEARLGLMKKFKLSELQAVAILEMRLQQLANLERLKIEDELKEKRQIMKELTTLLASAKKIRDVVKDELLSLKEQFATPRRTVVVKGPVGEFTSEDLIPDEPTVVAVTSGGYIKRLPPDSFRTQARGGKGVVGLTTKEDDFVAHLVSTNTHADLLFFTTAGRVFQLKAYEVPVTSRIAKGQAIVNFLQLVPDESVTAVLPFTDRTTFSYLVMGTSKGVVKKVPLEQFVAVRRSGLIAIRLRKDDILRWVEPSSGNDEILFVTKTGQSIRFKEKGVRSMGRSAGGVMGIRIRENDEVMLMRVLPTGKAANAHELIVVSELGFGKRTKLSNHKVQGRGGSGVKAADVTKKTGPLVGGAVFVPDEEPLPDLIVISTGGQVIRIPYQSVSLLGRVTQGVRLMRMKKPGDRVASVTLVG